MSDNETPENAQASWLKPFEKEVSSIEVDGEEYHYTLVDMEKVRAISGGLPYVVGHPTPDALFISDNVPAEFRPLILAHEIRHKTTFKDDPEEAQCKRAMEKELRDANRKLAPTQYKEYLLQRGQFFDQLVAHYESKEHRDEVSDGFREGIKSARFCGHLF